ncbi:glycosyl transferase family 1 [Iodidimonas muriae]|uniref:Glycosyl transferase family 1 n=1 Tax=Iodidimonas muriae TaxID=261467 RepID=A0ABQ2LG41_9PROT|nr:glycosyltransferase family 4 protein [Iodidimonas muriae]GER08818.1 glycosyl transferase family 1 [Kordiimonadales bacterium JCM 17843]GGO16733.1 glycosyl transferase family 1 [Iodidimonas muriae]
MNKKKVLLIVDNRVEYLLSHRYSLISEARRLGYEVHATTLTDGNVDKLIDNGILFHPISKKRRTGSVIDEFVLLLNLFKIFRTVKPTLIHNITIRSILYGGFLSCFRRKCSIVNSFTGLGYIFTDDKFIVNLLRRIVGVFLKYTLIINGAGNIFQNRDDYNLFVGNGWVASNKNIIIRGSGVNLNKFNCINKKFNEVVILYPARLIEHKGIYEFIEAARIVHNDFPDVKFMVAGDIDTDNPTAIDSKILNEWRKLEFIDFLGHRDDMPSIFNNASIVCLPTYREGMPKSLIEAAASGCALISTDVPGCREIVEDGVNGFLVPPRDPIALAEAMCKLITDKKRCKEMGMMARKTAEKEYSVENIVSLTLSFYEEVLNSSSTK